MLCCVGTLLSGLIAGNEEEEDEGNEGGITEVTEGKCHTGYCMVYLLVVLFYIR